MAGRRPPLDKLPKAAQPGSLFAVKQAGPATDDPNKLGLLWAAEWVLGQRTVEEIREFFAHLFENPLAAAAFPSYVNGFLLALKFTSLVVRLVVELLSRDAGGGTRLGRIGRRGAGLAGGSGGAGVATGASGNRGGRHRNAVEPLTQR